MVQRAVVLQRCQVCGASSPSRTAMEAHARDFHGNDPALEDGTVSFRTRAEATPEFQENVPSRTSTWGADLR